jgi:hypothetical protein
LPPRKLRPPTVVEPAGLHHHRPPRLFDERWLAAGVFVTANALGDGRLAWERTEIYPEHA